MKVICVSRIKDCEPGMEQAPRPEVGDIDEVIKTVCRYEQMYYILERFKMVAAYLSVHFAMLPDQPEEVIEQLEEATA